MDKFTQMFVDTILKRGNICAIVVEEGVKNFVVPRKDLEDITEIKKTIEGMDIDNIICFAREFLVQDGKISDEGKSLEKDFMLFLEGYL